MKSFEDFLLKNPMQRDVLSKMFIDEFEHSRVSSTNANSRLIAASMLAMSKMMDIRLREYHNWLNQAENNRNR